MGVVEVVALSAEDLQLITMADELSRARLANAEARHKAAYLEDMRTIQATFESQVQPVIDKHQVQPEDSCRFFHDENGMLVLEIVRRGVRVETPAAESPLAGVPG